MTTEKITFCDGNYKVKLIDGEFKVFLRGEEFYALSNNTLVFAMFRRIQELEERLNEVVQRNLSRSDQ